MTTLLAPGPATAAHTSQPYQPAAGYPRARSPRIVVTEPRRHLAICGTGAPGGTEFRTAMSTLYEAAYTLAFLLRDRGVDAHVGPLEALWQRRNGSEGWSVGSEAFDPTAWHWTLLLPLAQEATDDDVLTAIARARSRKPRPGLDRLHVIELDEGLVVEAMHVGPYSAEPATIEAMRVKAEAAGLAAIGSHHEIYLGDPNRTAPERLRTVLRQPVRPPTS